MNLIKDLSNAVIEGNSELAVSIAKNIITQGVDINDAIFKGLNEGMSIVSDLYAKREYFLPEIIISADALYDALEVFKPHLELTNRKNKAIVVIGVVRGDVHDIGKNLTKLFLEASGYKVIDCGRNVQPDIFIKTIKENNADVLALSTLMNPTLESITNLIELLKKENLKEKLKIIIGGAATSEQFAQKIGVIHCDDASKAARILDELILEEKTNGTN
jgi:methanogenic corrinoid protein MtbC1